MGAASPPPRQRSAASTAPGGPRSGAKTGSRRTRPGRRRSGRGTGSRTPPGRRRHPASTNQGRRLRIWAAPAADRQRACPYRSAGSGSRVPRASPRRQETYRRGFRWSPSTTPPRRSAGRPFVSAAAAPPIDADEQKQPDDIDEMPIPSRCLEAEMVVRLEMPEPCPDQADDQKGRADDDVEAVKARRHEEGGRKDAAGKMEGGVAVLVSLDRGEAQTEEDGERQTTQHAVAVACEQRMVRPGHGRARQQQDQRVEKRKLERIERMDALGRPHAADWEQTRGKERPEEAHEEHHLGGDEQRHAIAHTELHDRGMVALEGRLADHVAPPHGHDPQYTQNADDHQRPAMAVHIEDGAAEEQARGDGAEDRPRAGIDQMVRVLRRRVRFAHGFWPRRINLRNAPLSSGAM